MIEEGDIFLTITFEGPTAVAYPQLRDDVTSFDDTDRKKLAKKDELEKEKEKEKEKLALQDSLLPPAAAKEVVNNQQVISR